MQIVIIHDLIHDKFTAITTKEFINKANEEFFESNDFNGDREYFSEEFIDYVIARYNILNQKSYRYELIKLQEGDKQ